MGLLLVERLVEDLLEGTAEGKLEEDAVVEELDEAEDAEAEVAIGSEFLQGVVLLLYLLSDLRGSSMSKRPESSPKAARICEIFGCSDIVTSD